jgi:hypothetical protein
LPAKSGKNANSIENETKASGKIPPALDGFAPTTIAFRSVGLAIGVPTGVSPTNDWLATVDAKAAARTKKGRAMTEKLNGMREIGVRAAGGALQCWGHLQL